MRYGSTNIDCLIRLRLSLFLPCIKQGMEEGRDLTLTLNVNHLSYGRICYFATFYKDAMAFVFRWAYDGQERRQLIRIMEQESNLANGSKVLYFLCGGHRCRTLYSDGRGLYSRNQFSHHYGQQGEGRLDRTIRHLDNPERKFGKETYRGKVTPYGRRLQRFYEKDAMATNALMGLLKRLK